MNFGKTFLAALLAVIVGTLLAGIFMMMIFAGIFAAFESKPIAPGSNSVLRIDFTNGVTDEPRNTPFESVGFTGIALDNSNSILQVLEAIDNASYDNNIKGIYINVTGGSVSLANVEEIRAALETFRNDSGKFVIAYSQVYSQIGYYLASVADKVFVHPEGGVSWQGLAAQIMFFKGMLEKLGVEVEILRHGSFKSAVEPYMLDRMSPENRLQLDAMLGNIWQAIIEDISASRGIAPEMLSIYADHLSLNNAEDALAYGFVDGILYEDQVNMLFSRLTSAGSRGVDEELQRVMDAEHEALAVAAMQPADSADLTDPAGEPDTTRVEESRLPDASNDVRSVFRDFIDLSDYISYAGMRYGSGHRADRIAIVYIDGAIIDGESSRDNVGGATVAEKLVRARTDKSIKGVVVRVNSPGGSALASDVMWREMELLRREKPVIVSMGAYAASGGYYVSCPADIILAGRSTITGSIGVLGLMPNVGKSMKNLLGITTDVAKTSDHADMGSIFRPLASREREFLQNSIEAIYRTFIGHVAAGRNLTVERVDQIGGGRVWSGTDALGVGLVDGIGGLTNAIELCADRAGVSGSYRVKEILDEPDKLSVLLKSLMASERARIALRNELGQTFVQYKKLLDMVEQSGVQARMPYEIEIR